MTNTTNTLASSQINNTMYSANKNEKMIILEHEEIEMDKINKNELGDSFCNGFFLAGLQSTNSKFIPESENQLGPCGHKKCAILSAYRPDILQSFPNNNIEGIELNTSVKIKIN